MNIMLRAYLDNNLGDDLMIKLLVERFPQHNFWLYSNSTTVSNTYKKHSNVKVKSIDKIKTDLKYIDVFITIGGSIFQLKTFKQHLTRVSKILFLKFLKFKKIKVITLGANLGPFANKFSYKLVELELRQNNLTTVRDSDSMKIIDNFKGIKNCHKTEDIVYYLNEMNGKKKSGLGISTYRSTNNNENNFDNYLTLSKIADEYIERTGENVKLFAFDSEKENDLVSAHHIYNLSKNKEKILIIPYLGDIEAFLAEFSNCQRLIAIRFHSAILADIYKIPFLPIVYSNKMKNLLEDKNYTGLSLPLADLKSDLDINLVIDSLITGNRIVNNFVKQEQRDPIHFEELEKILTE